MKDGWIKTGNYGKTIIDGITYIEMYPLWIRPLYRLQKKIQKFLWRHGIAVHDFVFGECTPDFNCCNDSGKKTIIKIGNGGKDKNLMFSFRYDKYMNKFEI